MIVLYNLVPDSNASKLERTLPIGYIFEQIETEKYEAEKFAIFWGSEQVAVVSAEPDGFQFQFSAGKQGDRLENLINILYNSDDLRWLVIFPSSKKEWSYIGVPEKTKEAALKWVNVNTMDRMAVLVSYLPSQRSDNRIVVRSANYLKGEWPKVDVEDESMGAIAFYLSAW